MAESSGGGEKTEKPTAKKLKDAAEKGDILQSRDLATALVVMAGIGWIAVTGPSMVESLSDMLIEALRFRREDIVNFAHADRGFALLSGIPLPVAGILMATLLAALPGPGMLGSTVCRLGASGHPAPNPTHATGPNRA